MFVLEGKAGFRMVKVAGRLNSMKCLAGMTVAAVGAELVMVRIVVTIGTALEFHPCKLLKLLSIQYGNLVT